MYVGTMFQFGAYCEGEYMKNVIWTLTTFGVLCGAVLWAWISDRLGFYQAEFDFQRNVNGKRIH